MSDFDDVIYDRPISLDEKLIGKVVSQKLVGFIKFLPGSAQS
jgi:hypothetical protein